MFRSVVLLILSLGPDEIQLRIHERWDGITEVMSLVRGHYKTIQDKKFIRLGDSHVIPPLYENHIKFPSQSGPSDF